ncbi:MAG: ABC transporter ATP-binding protein/permease [Clostridia bacterium]|nr:ABC transporter ATP-binding protein/permease [Clostridia bacterium]
MIRMVHRILTFCGGGFAARIRTAYLFAFLKSVCQNAPIFIAVMMLRRLMNGTATILFCCLSAGMLLAFLALGSVFQYLADRLQSAAGYEVFAEKRKAFAAHLRRLPMGYFTAGNLGRISSILSADMVFIEENSMNIVADVVSDSFAQLVLTAFMFTLHPLLGVAALTTACVAAGLAFPMNRESMRNSGARQQAIEDLTGSVIEYTEGLAVSKSFSITGESAAELRQSFARSRDANLTFERQHTPWERALQIVYALGTAAILLLSVWLFQRGQLDNAAFVGVTLFLLNVFAPFKHLFQLDSRLTIMENCLDRLDEVFAEKPLPLDGSKELPGHSEHELEFEHVSFAYGEETILHDICFSADKGQMVALVGESGSGKTTVANLLARFWDVREGSVKLRGVDLRELPMETLMAQISMVFQKVYLFEDTVFNNIAMGRPEASYEEVAEAAKKARCYDFIMRLPFGFDTVVGEGGASLSGGEAQRISIARCILKDAPVIILDEATASVDADNEAFIQQAMSELCRDKTVLVIAHRLNTIRGADQILVLDHGRIIERGDHEELMSRGGAYRHMVELQEQNSSWNREVSA